MSLTKINLNMIQTPLSGILGGSNSVINHNGAFIIGNNISTTNSNALYVNDLRVTGRLYGDASTLDNIGVAFTTEMWTNVALSGWNTTNTPEASANDTQIATTEFVKASISNYVTDELTTSPSLSGEPITPTPPTSSVNLIVANTEFVVNYVKYVTDNSVALSGTPTVPTAATTGTDLTIANREYVNNYVQYVTDNSVALSGTPTAPTAATTGVDFTIANREYVNNYVQYVTDNSVALSGTPTAPTAATNGTDFTIANREYVNNYVQYVTDNSVALSGAPTAPTAATNGTDFTIANREYVNNYVKYVTDNSVALSGTPTATTPALSSNNNEIATTKFIKDQQYLQATDRSLTDRLAQNAQGSLILGLNALNNESTLTNSVSSGLNFTSTSTEVEITVFEDHGIVENDYILTSDASDDKFEGVFRVLSVTPTSIIFENPTSISTSGTITAVKTDRANLAVGPQALNSVTTGKNNLGLGFDAGTLITTTNNNISIGNHAQSNYSSVSIGVCSNSNNYSTSIGNKASGYGRGVTVGDSSVGGVSGVAIGYMAAAQAGNIAIGAMAKALSHQGAIVLGANAEASSSHLVIGSDLNPVNNSTVLDGRTLEIKLNNGIGYIPVYDTSIASLPQHSGKDERTSTSSSPTSGSINFDTLSQTNLYHIADASGNFSLNIRANSSTSLNDLLSVGESVTVRFYYVNGASAYSSTGLTIDGAQQGIYWQNNTNPIPLTRSVNYYQYIIVKTNNATYDVFGSFGNFGASDPSFVNVSLLLHGDGTQGSTSFIDSSTNNLTVNGNDNAQIDTTIKKFGTGSIKFDGSSDYLTVAPTSLLDFGTGQFTIEFWTYITSNADQTILLVNGDSSNPGLGGLSISLDSSRRMYVHSKINGSSSWDFDSGAVNAGLSLNTWHFIALNRDNTGNIKLFRDGMLIYSNTWAGSILSNGQTYIGALNNNTSGFHGYLEDLRITKGIARYSLNFTPPSTPLPNQ